MTTKHPHHEVITAYLEGKDIQFRLQPNHKWTLVESLKNLSWIMPTFTPEVEYRIRPVTEVKMRVTMEDYRVFTREVEHWEQPNAIFFFNSETSKLESVEVV